MKILNWITDRELDQLKGCGWIERQRQALPHEHRILVTLWHPRQTIGEGNDRHQTAVQTFRSLPLDQPMQLALFPQPRTDYMRAGVHVAPSTTPRRMMDRGLWPRLSCGEQGLLGCRYPVVPRQASAAISDARPRPEGRYRIALREDHYTLGTDGGCYEHPR